MQYDFENILHQECMDEKGLFVNLPEPKCKLLDEKVPKKKRLWGEKLLSQIGNIEPNPKRVQEMFDCFSQVIGPEWKEKKSENHILLGKKSDVVDLSYFYDGKLLMTNCLVDRNEMETVRKEEMDEYAEEGYDREKLTFEIKERFDSYIIRVACFESENFIVDNFEIDVGYMKEKDKYDDYRCLTTIFKKDTKEYIILANNGHPMIECSEFRVLFSDGHGVDSYHECYPGWQETKDMIWKFYGKWTRY